MRREFPMILVRIVVGLVFLLEGTLKFLRPQDLGAGRFQAIGLPFPEQLAPLVGGVEIGGGLAILLNLYAGDAALALIVVILSALVSTKIPILLGHKLGSFPVPNLPHYGLLTFLHEARTDLAMLFGLAAIAVDSGVRVGHRRHWYQGD